MRGWLAVIAREKSALRQVVGYRELALLFAFYMEFEIVPLMRLRPGSLMTSDGRSCALAQWT